ncbi:MULTISPECIES: hypothetical protein [Carboxydocella]|uniref:Nucleotidase n=2 Tax=Carboxydocella TaxID=178898 RepID=A0A1T4LSL3_9FIRM|nr:MULTISPECIES: hypothetical protein [Carboxydocella]AVX20598.1 hypothetical protein CFE_1409 [Carboxydocella thermautotrophica]AVX31020.1 hypothetical protein CTH_1430 [Carboxydocella thermautotrophica]GAW31525.1 hypothetical protein JDF658_12900 [Carboxydocella sp. JDF658]SJZ57729.1 hypothetical protein SAMN02745885_00290 [Carboxydocella sporoproducens DSM 16521]
MNIGIDIDGVLADSVTQWLNVMNKYFGQNKKYEELYTYRFEKVYNVTWEEMDRFFRTNQEILLSNLSPIPNSVSAVKKLKIWGHKIYLVTARPRQYQHLTTKWLKEHQVEYDQLIMTDFQCKADYCQELQLKVFIDDSLDNAMAIASRGIKVFLYNAPYNQGHFPDNLQILRKNSWSEILTEVKKMR